MRYKLFLLLVFFSLITACKQDIKQETTANVPTPTTEDIPKIESEPIPVVENKETPTLRQATPLTAHAQQFFASAYWHYDAAVVVKAPEKSKDYIGKWVKLNPDHTLETGYYGQTSATGNWILDEGKNIITLVENGEQPIYSEWQVKTSSSSDAIMIWVGTKRFNQNNIQIKMLKYNDKPTKKVGVN